jgi:hypothetical protein
MTPAEGIEAILVDAGVGGDLPWIISVSRFRTDPDMQIAIMDLPGKQPEVLIAQSYPGVQVLIRGSKSADGYTAAYAKSREAFNVLQAIPCPAAAYPELVSCIARHEPAPLGYDDQSRPLFSLNFDLIITPDELGHRIY